MNEIFKRETESEALAPDVDCFHDARVLELPSHEAVFKQVGTLALVWIHTSRHTARTQFMTRL